MKAGLQRPTPVPEPPRDEAELLRRARGLAGRTLHEVAARAGIALPQDQRRAKGLVGQLLERSLGADAGSAAEPDFRSLGVELKTIPLGRDGRPRESTFVCSIRLDEIGELEWERSRACKKLRRVLWVPVESERDVPLARRRVGAALLWSPSAAQERDLRDDWEEIASLIGRGDLELITAHLGRYLQVRPKARNADVRKRALDGRGAPVHALPRGFYLRTRFTARLFAGD
ncbi:MAG: DNA mismatch repair endonuclease MutH [Myxococcales bacterium]